MEIRMHSESENSLSRGKKFHVALFDFLLMIICCAILFAAFLLFFRGSDQYEQMQRTISSAEAELAEVCTKTKLTSLETSEDGATLLSMEHIADEYVLGQVYASYILRDDPQQMDTLFADATEMTVENDPCYYYITQYRTNHKANYANFSEEITEEYYLKATQSLGGIYNGENYPVLTPEAADAVFAYLKGDSDDTRTHDRIKNMYLTMLQELVSDFMENCSAYKSAQQKYEQANLNMYSYYVYALLIAYCLSMVIFYLVIPLCFKDGRTVFMRLFRLRCLDVEKNDVGAGQVVIRFVCQLLLYLFAPLLILLCCIDTATFYVIIFIRFFNYFNLVSLGTFALVLNVCNMIFTFYSKKKKQTIAEFAAQMITVEDSRVRTIKIGEKTVQLH